MYVIVLLALNKIIKKKYNRINQITHFRFMRNFQVYVGALSLHYEALSVEASKQTTAEEIVSCIVERLGLPVSKLD